MWRRMREQVCRDGMDATVLGSDFGDLAQTLVGLAQDGLSRWQPEAAHLLDGLSKRTAQRMTPADALVAHYRKNTSQRELLELSRII